MFEKPMPATSFSERKEYPPVGHCIYCGSTDNLTDEHTLASGLGGRHVLPDSSCEECRRIITQPEQYVQRTPLHNARKVYGIQSHRKRPRLPTSIRIRKNSGEEVEIAGEWPDIPLLLVLPIFPNPTILASDAPASDDPIRTRAWSPEPRGYKEFLAKHDANKIISKDIRTDLLARVVAKTAHAHAIAMLGTGAFKPLLPDVILGRTNGNEWNRVVGGEMPHAGDNWRMLKPTPHHLNSFVVFDWFRERDGKCFYVGALRFFPNLGGPTYYAVLGEPIPPRPPWRMMPPREGRFKVAASKDGASIEADCK